MYNNSYHLACTVLVLLQTRLSSLADPQGRPQCRTADTANPAAVLPGDRLKLLPKVTQAVSRREVGSDTGIRHDSGIKKKTV